MKKIHIFGRFILFGSVWRQKHLKDGSKNEVYSSLDFFPDKIIPDLIIITDKGKEIWIIIFYVVSCLTVTRKSMYNLWLKNVKKTGEGCF